MSLRQLRTRIEHLEAKSPEPEDNPEDNEERAARARWGELQLRRTNEVEKPLTEEEEAEFWELMYRFEPMARSIKAWEEAHAKAVQEGREWSARRRRERLERQRLYE